MAKFLLKEATTDAEFEACFRVIQELYPRFKTLEDMLPSLNQVRSEGYRILYCAENDQIISYIGFRISTVLFTGRTLHIADLSTLASARGKGAAGALLDSITEFAKKDGCNH